MTDSNPELNDDEDDEVEDQTTNGLLQDAIAAGEADSDRATRLNRPPIGICDPSAMDLYQYHQQRRRERRVPYVSMYHPSRYVFGDAELYLLDTKDVLTSLALEIYLADVNVHHPYVNESTPVEDSRPNDMPAPTDGSANTNAVSGNGTALVLTGSSVVQEPVRVVAPTEYPYEYDHPTYTRELNSNQQLDVESESDERRSCPNSPLAATPHIIDQGEALINAGSATVNTETVNEQNATDITVDQTNSNSALQLLCSEIVNRGRNVQTSTVDVSQATEHGASLLNPPAPKVPETIDGSGGLSQDSVD